MINQKFNCVLNTKISSFFTFPVNKKIKKNNRSLKGVRNKAECGIVCCPIKSVLLKKKSFAIVYVFFSHIVYKTKMTIDCKKSDIDFGKCPTIRLKIKKTKTKKKISRNSCR